MKIRRLEILGFKSFADRTVLRYDDGITGVVGPNGCGKSNLVDALRWVMGEQSARKLRGKNMEDVIFAGSETKPPMGMSEVRLSLENDGRNVAQEYASYSEITVGRRLFRSGESEYSINRTPCRLLDVQELFMGTGVGTRAYSIISQGQVGLLVSQKPIERRALIEEAAGISKYKARKKIAERKMEQTQQNLVRVHDVVQEIGRQINSLKRQARKASRYNKLKEQLREIDLHLHSHRYLEMKVNQRYLTESRNHLVQSEAQMQSTMAELEASLEQNRAQLLEDDRELAKHQEELLSIDNQIKLNEKNIEFLDREIESSSERGTQWAMEIEKMRSEIGVLVEQIQAAEKEVEETSSLAETSAQRRQEREIVYETQARKVDEALSSVDNIRKNQINLEEQSGNLKTSMSTLRQRLEDLEARRTQAETELATIRRTMVEIEEKRTEQNDRLTRTRATHSNLIEKRKAAENTLQDLKAQLGENEAKRLALWEEIGNKRSRLKSLQEIEQNYEGCLRGVRWVMKQAETHKRSEVVGLVADILRTPARYEAAVQAVLGDRLQSVVVESREAGLEAVDFLKKEAEGRSSFIPLALRNADAQPAWYGIKSPGVVGGMSKLIEYNQEYEPIVNYLVGDVLVVEDLNAAIDVWTSNGHDATLVTLEGDVLDPQGVLTGGSFEGAGTHLLKNKREIREIDEKLKILEAEHRLLKDREGKLKAQNAEVTSSIESLLHNTHQEEIRIVDQQKDVNHLDEQYRSNLQRLENLTYQCEEYSHQAVSIQQQIQRDKQLLEEVAKRQQGMGSDIQSMQKEAEEQKHTLARMAQEVSDLRVQAAAGLERLESARRNLEHLVRKRADLEQRIQKLKDEINTGTHRISQGKDQKNQCRAEIHILFTQREEKQARLAVKKEAYDLRFAEVNRDEAKSKECRQKLDLTSQKSSETKTRLREIEISLEHLCRQVFREYKEDLSVCVASYHLLPEPGDVQIEKADKLRTDLERMGDVNPHAVEAYQELIERYDFMIQQSKDLKESLDKLRKVIQKINRASRDRFSDAFKAIDGRFREVFPRLFTGGKAHLVLEDNEDVLEAGVDIVVQPPGKKLQNIELLSGGEKALSAIALLFSIFLVKPTPFCVLDEVDAPLDDSNLSRFNAMVREMSASSQFIIITHNKHTMEAVDRLYGITMEEPGVSRMVTVRLRTDEDTLRKAV